ncbi:MAG: hypothetical protein KAQ85_01355 [Thermodesulfovibrionia bacterium]|nr:hypothetical protein [Thermodesulfovibrionia bacterium]
MIITKECGCEIKHDGETIEVNKSCDEHIKKNREFHEFFGKQFRVLSERCPDCNDRLISNSKYVECGDLHCKYIKAKK